MNHFFGSFFDLVTLFYCFTAVKLGVEVWQKRATLFGPRLTPENERLARGIAFYFLWPPAVLLHEFGHMLTASSFGATNIHLHFLFYWGYVSFDPGLTVRQEWWVALAGNAVTLALGILPLPYIQTLKGSPTWRVMLYHFCKFQLFQVLIWYPALCLAFAGDFQAIYGPVYWWLGSTLTACLHAILLAGYAWAEYASAGKRWVLGSILGWQPRPSEQNS